MTELEAELLGLLDAKILREIEPDRIEGIRDLVLHGEVGIAAENLCENVFDVEGPLDDADHAWLARLDGIVQSIGLRAHYSRIVREVMARSRRRDT